MTHPSERLDAYVSLRFLKVIYGSFAVTYVIQLLLILQLLIQTLKYFHAFVPQYQEESSITLSRLSLEAIHLHSCFKKLTGLSLLPFLYASYCVFLGQLLQYLILTSLNKSRGNSWWFRIYISHTNMYYLMILS